MRSLFFSLCSNLALSAGNTPLPPPDETLVVAEIFFLFAGIAATTTTDDVCFAFLRNSSNSSSTFSKYFFASSFPSSNSNANLKSLLASSKHSTRLDTVIFSESVFLAKTAPLATYASTCFGSSSIARSNAFNAIINRPLLASFTPDFVASRAHPHLTLPRISLNVNNAVVLLCCSPLLLVFFFAGSSLFLLKIRFLSLRTTGNPKCLRHSCVACAALNSTFLFSKAQRNGICFNFNVSSSSSSSSSSSPPNETFLGRRRRFCWAVVVREA
mmetsp:Transcript_67/g.217  ORF Transcript_67/g.217 Transcript_67/m.217 type:complete len:271 (+) Transcript_67:292-1104(+)